MGFKLVRLATLYFSHLSDEWHSWKITVGHIQIETMGSYQLENKIRLLVAAGVTLRYRPKLTAGRRVVIPEHDRLQLEAEIEAIANLISVTERTKRSVSSPTPCAALIPDDDMSKEFLEKADGFLAEPCDRTYFGASGKIEILDKLDLLSDRPDGVALLAESLSHEHATGKFHEYIRIFERAFRLPAGRLSKPLSEFLNASKFGYTEAEVNRWLDELRDAATHADEKRNFVIEADVRPVIRRMEQAAYDVVFNKTEWRAPTTTRRDVLVMTTGTTSNSSSIFAKQGSEGTLEIQLLDEFCSFPLDLSAGLEKLPEGWWSKPFLAETDV